MSVRWFCRLRRQRRLCCAWCATPARPRTCMPSRCALCGTHQHWLPPLTFSSQVTGRVSDLPWLICLVTLNSCDSVYDFLLGPVQCHSMSLFLKGSFQCAQFCCFSDCLSTFPVRLRPHSMPAKQRERVVEWLTVWCLICSDASTSRLVVTRSRRARLTRLSVLWHDVL